MAERVFDTTGMGHRRTSRGLPPRTDYQIVSQAHDVAMLEAIGRGRVTVDPENHMQLKRLAREDLCLAGFASGTSVTLLPRGLRIVGIARGELPSPHDE